MLAAAMMATGQKPGSLVDALVIFKDHGVNMSKLESRPVQGNPWEEMFYIDFEGNIADPAITEAIDELTTNFRYNDAVIRNLVIRTDEAITSESPIMKAEKESRERRSSRPERPERSERSERPARTEEPAASSAPATEATASNASTDAASE